MLRKPSLQFRNSGTGATVGLFSLLALRSALFSFGVACRSEAGFGLCYFSEVVAMRLAMLSCGLCLRDTAAAAAAAAALVSVCTATPASWGCRSVDHAASARRQLVSGGSWDLQTLQVLVVLCAIRLSVDFVFVATARRLVALRSRGAGVSPALRLDLEGNGCSPIQPVLCPEATIRLITT